MDKSQNSPVEESDAVKAVLEPYMEILKPSEDIRRLQATLMNQGKIKNMTLPYSEITALLSQVGTLAATMPAILTDGIHSWSEALDQVA